MRTQEEKDKLFEQALQIAKDKRLIFIDEIVAYLPISREEERKKLAMSYVDNTTKGEKINGIQVEIIRNKDEQLEADSSD